MAFGIPRKPMKPLKVALPRSGPRPLSELAEASGPYAPAAAAVAKCWTDLLLTYNDRQDEQSKASFGRAFYEALRDVTARDMEMSHGKTVVMTHDHPGFGLTEAIQRAGGDGLFTWKLPPFTITVVSEHSVLEQDEKGKMTTIWGTPEEEPNGG